MLKIANIINTIYTNLYIISYIDYINENNITGDEVYETLTKLNNNEELNNEELNNNEKLNNNEELNNNELNNNQNLNDKEINMNEINEINNDNNNDNNLDVVKIKQQPFKQSKNSSTEKNIEKVFGGGDFINLDLI